MLEPMSIPREPLFPLLSAVRSATQPPPGPSPMLGPLSWGDVLEIQGPSDALGKSQLVYDLVAVCIMPPSHNFVALGGWGKAAVLFDTDGTFDARQLREMIEQRVLRAFSRSKASPDAQRLAAEALHMLHVFRPVSTAQLAASLYALPTYHKTRMSDADIGLVAVDSLSAFYWPDRFTAEQLRAPGSPMLHHVLEMLQQFRASHNPVIVLTNWGLTVAQNLSTDSSTGPSTAPLITYKQHLPSFAEFPPSTVSTDVPFPRPSSKLSLSHHITLSLTLTPPISGDEYDAILPRNDAVIAFVRRPGSSRVVTLNHDILGNDER